jgi:hypothetical protein
VPWSQPVPGSGPHALDLVPGPVAPSTRPWMLRGRRRRLSGVRSTSEVSSSNETPGRSLAYAVAPNPWKAAFGRGFPRRSRSLPGLLPAAAILAPIQTTENVVYRANGKTGATGLEPATSGVTGGLGACGLSGDRRGFPPWAGLSTLSLRSFAGTGGSFLRPHAGLARDVSLSQLTTNASCARCGVCGDGKDAKPVRPAATGFRAHGKERATRSVLDVCKSIWEDAASLDV